MRLKIANIFVFTEKYNRFLLAKTHDYNTPFPYTISELGYMYIIYDKQIARSWLMNAFNDNKKPRQNPSIFMSILCVYRIKYASMRTRFRTHTHTHSHLLYAGISIHCFARIILFNRKSINATLNWIMQFLQLNSSLYYMYIILF